MNYYRCGGGGITATKLWEAIQYSGLVEEGATSKEMLEALENHFVGTVQIVSGSVPCDGFEFLFDTTQSTSDPDGTADYYQVVSEKDPNKLLVTGYVKAHDQKVLKAYCNLTTTVNKKALPKLKIQWEAKELQDNSWGYLSLYMNGQWIEGVTLTSNRSGTIIRDLSSYENNSDITIKMQLITEINANDSQNLESKFSMEIVNMLLTTE